MTTETTQEARARYRTRSETVTAIQLTEDNGPAVLAFCGIPDVPGLKATIKALPGEDGNRMQVSLRPGDWIVKHGSVPHEHFTVHGPTAFGMAYEPDVPVIEADPMWQQAYMDVQKVLDQALGTEEEDGAGGGIAGDVWLLAHQRDGARAERDRLQNACKHMGSVIVSMSRQLECARIEMAQNGPEKAMQWILNGLPDVDDNPAEMRWDGKESADEWFERTADYARSEAAK